MNENRPAEPAKNGGLPPRLAATHAWVQSQGWLRRFTLANRLLLAMAFFPTGLVKLLGRRFVPEPTDKENVIGHFFETMYQTGLYWQFIGLMQVLAAVLLLIPRTAALGAVLFLPIGLSVFLITVGMGFGGTPFVTGGMLLSVTYLICWDADRIWRAGAPMFARGTSMSLLRDMHWLETSGWILGGLVGIGLFMSVRGFFVAGVPAMLLAGVGAIVMVVTGWIVGAFARRGERLVPHRGAPTETPG